MKIRHRRRQTGATAALAALRQRTRNLRFRATGTRDVIWCPYLNEPAILEYRDGEPWCPNCNGNYEPQTHQFIVNVRKP